jgi:glycine cleavage system transcriptional repressor
VAHFAVTAIGVDRPGIVAAVTEVLVEHGCNLEDTSMSILRGHFAMMLVVAAPDGLEADGLEAALAGATSQLDLVVSVRAIAEPPPHPEPAGESWTVSVYGADRPGIVHRIASVLAEEGVNIVDLTTRVVGEDEQAVYAMLLDVTLPAGAPGAAVGGRLEEAAAELGVECSMHPSEADIL